jgi:hypothetical protein
MAHQNDMSSTDDPQQAAPHAVRPSTRGVWRRRLGRFVLIAVGLLVVTELFARFYLGLGDPPLSVADPEIEYMFAPSQEVRRLGNRIHYNAYSMRSDDFPRHKADPDELRVIVIGDSVINGGAQTDQSQLATSILQDRLSEALGRSVIVGNVSAVSWGPPNQLAYVRRFGLFDADLLVVVASSHDYADMPSFEPAVGVQLGFPDRKPALAMQEVIVRYLWPRIMTITAASVPSHVPPEPEHIERCLNDLREMIVLAQTAGAEVMVAQYWDLREMTEPLHEGHGMIRDVAEDTSAEVVQLGPAFLSALQEGRQPFRDVIHPSPSGQAVIADVLYEPILNQLRRRIEYSGSEIPASDSGGSGRKPLAPGHPPTPARTTTGWTSWSRGA